MMARQGSRIMGRVLLAGVAFTAPTTAAYAQSADADAAAPDNDDIVVTASRTGAQSIQKVPIAISVVDPDQLNRQGGQGFSDYLNAVPSVSVQSLGPGQNKITIRGFSTGTFAPTDTQDRTLVAVYLDDTPLSLQGNTPDLKVFDLERVEVLRGPQGALYGASAMAGLVRFITVKPKLDTVEGNAEGVLSTSERGGTNYSVRGTVNIPLITDKVALRIGGYYGYNSGFIDNIGTGERDANDDRTIQLRVAGRIMVGERLTLDPSFIFSRLRTGGEPSVLAGLAGVGPGEYRSNTPEFYRDNLKLYNLTATYDLDWASLVSSTSYVDRSFARNYGGEYLVKRLALRNSPVSPFDLVSPNDIASGVKDFVQEVRINSTTDSAFGWILGAFYQKQKRGLTQTIYTPGYDALRAPLNAGGALIPSTAYGTPGIDTPFYGDQSYRERQIAVFGELSYKLTPELKVAAGGRYFDWRQGFDLYYGGLLGALGPGRPLIRDDVAKANGFNPRATISYQATSDILLFAEAAKGFRFGGVNDPIPDSCGIGNANASFGPDKTWSYSAGAKTRLFDRLTFNVTGYRADWSDIQTLFVISQCSYGVRVNSGDVRIQGLELETALKVTDNLSLSLNGSYTDAKTRGDVPNVGARDGARPPYVPEILFSAAVDFRYPVSNGDIQMRVQYDYKDKYTNIFDKQINPATLPFVFPNSQLLHASINFVTDTWEIGLFGRNLTDENTLIGRGSNNTYGFRESYARGRTLGARAAMKF